MGALAAILAQLLFYAIILYGVYWAVRIAVRHAVRDTGVVDLLRSAVETDEYGEEYDEEESIEDPDEDEEGVRR